MTGDALYGHPVPPLHPTTEEGPTEKHPTGLLLQHEQLPTQHPAFSEIPRWNVARPPRTLSVTVREGVSYGSVTRHGVMEPCVRQRSLNGGILEFRWFLNARAVQLPQSATGGHEVLPNGTAQLSRIRVVDSIAA